MSLNHQLSDLFATMAALMDLKGASPFKAIAFSKISRVLKDMTFDIKEAVEKGTLKDIEGIGPASRKMIEEFVRTGRSTDFEEVAASVPPGLIPMLEIPGLGPKTIATIWKERGVTSIEGLVKAIDEGKLEGLKGIGAKKIEGIKQGITIRSQSAGRMGIAHALPIAEALVQRLREMKQVKRAEYAGSLRRRRETVGDLDLVCCVADSTGPAVVEAFTRFPEVERVLGQGPTKGSVITAGGLQVDLRVVPVENFGAALLYFTGSKDHNVKLRGRALDMDMTLNEWGLYDLAAHEVAQKKTGEPPQLKPVASKAEEDVYRKLKLAYVEPELREDRGEVEAAEAGTLPKLVTVADVRGDLHTHTTASDGTASIEQMADAALARGYAFLAITDHSKSQVIANGLTAERLLKHTAAIRKANDRYRGQITLLAGCEVDILTDGSLDFDETVLAELDIVVASPHIALKQDPVKATDRIRRAIDARYVNIIGHPTGRLIGGREGLPVDFSKLFPLAASNGTAMEINSGYPRLDLHDVNARAALQAGCLLSINTDAHGTDGFDEIVYGIGVARRAWATAENVVNCMSTQALRAFLARKR
ncbi:MAG TPA: DNA polymerase/3'-5' exonuclease PolX [Tepidisphaeraceae bacterium]|nr:DNA polymerase/3'-5' exonuclease PolX [Tepidisphaeraceae bacterium]